MTIECLNIFIRLIIEAEKSLQELN